MFLLEHEILGTPPVEETLSTSQSSGPMTVENPKLDIVLLPPKKFLPWPTHNPDGQASPNYGIVEDFAQAPCVMSALEVLQAFPVHHKALFAANGGIDPSDSNVISFDVDLSEPHLSYQPTFHLSYQPAFQIHVVVKERDIFHMVIDKGACTCIMFVYCLKVINSPFLATYLTILKELDGLTFQPYGILTAFPIE